MAWYDDLAAKVGISSKSLGINDQAAKDARAAEEAQVARDAEIAAMQERENRTASDAYRANLDKERLRVLQQKQNYDTGYDESREMANIYNTPIAIPEKSNNGILDFFKTSTGQTILGGGANVAGGLLGYGLSKEGYKDSENTLRDAQNNAGFYETLGNSEAAAVQDNQAMLAARNSAIQGLQDRATMGLTPEDQAQLNQVRNQTNSQFQARQSQIQQDMRRRGLGNSGMNLASQMIGNQGLSQMQSNQADETAKMSFQNKQSALANLGNTAGNALQQDFDRDLNRAKNKDAVNEFNVQAKTRAAQNKAAYGNAIAASQATQAQNKGNMASNALGTVGGLLLGKKA